MVQVLCLSLLPACHFSGYKFVEHDLTTPAAVNQHVNALIQYDYYHSKEPRPIKEIESTRSGNCTDIAAYKQHLLSKVGVKSYRVKGITTDGQMHAVVMVYVDGERWFLDNRHSFMTQNVFKDFFYNINTKEVIQL